MAQIARPHFEQDLDPASVGDAIQQLLVSVLLARWWLVSRDG